MPQCGPGARVCTSPGALDERQAHRYAPLARPVISRAISLA